MSNDIIRLNRAIVGLVDRLSQAVDDIAEHGLFCHNLGIVVRIGTGWHTIDKLNQIGQTTDILQIVLAVQDSPNSRSINGIIAVIQRYHSLEDNPVRIFIKIFGLNIFPNRNQLVWANKNRPQDSLLSKQILRLNPQLLSFWHKSYLLTKIGQ